MKPLTLIAALVLSCASAHGLDRARPVVDVGSTQAFGVCGPDLAAVPDVVGGPGVRPGERGRDVSVAPVVGTSVLAGLIALVLAILRRRKRASADAAAFPPGGEGPANQVRP